MMSGTSPFPISVVIPLFQKARHIRNALDKALASCLEAGSDFEIVVVDDGSTDGSAGVVIDWMRENNRYSDVITLIHQENGGASAARNTGWRAARHENILFLDADDEWMPCHVSEIISLMQDFPDATLYADAWYEISPEGKRIDHDFGIGSDHRGYLPCFFEAMSSGPMIVSSNTAATRKRHLEMSGGFPEGISHGEDKIGWGRLALLGKVAWSPRIGAVWDKTSENRSDKRQPTKESAFRAFMQDALQTADLSEGMRRNIEIAIAVDEAYMSGRIRLYGRSTPEMFRSILESVATLEDTAKPLGL